MSLSIFYSWQSDSPKETNRDFIESMLEKAITRLSGDVELQEAIRDEPLVLEKDTKGIPGTPPIVDTINELPRGLPRGSSLLLGRM